MPQPAGSILINIEGNDSPFLRTVENMAAKANKIVQASQRAQNSFIQPLGRITGAANEFQKSLEAANARVIAFGATAGSIFVLRDAFKRLLTSTVEVERQMTDLEAVFNLGRQSLQRFSTDLFAVANATSTTFSDAAKAATEFARQGLSVEETLKRTAAALTINKLSGLAAEDAVASLTSTLNAFVKEGIRAEDVLNRLTAVDANFAVSMSDLSEALKRVSASASDANVTFNQTIALVTAAQQVTARGGSVIGNSFKSMFTRLQRPKVIDDLEAAGVKVRDLNGKIIPMISVLKNLATTYDTLSSSQKSFISETVGGVYQINILKAILRDLGSGLSVVDGALDTAANSSGAAQKRLELLNNTISSQLIRTLNELTRASSNVGGAIFGSTMRNGISGLETMLKHIADLTDKNKASEGSVGSQAFSNAAQGALKGLGNIIQGPGLQFAIFTLMKLFERLEKFIVDSAKDIGGLHQKEKERIAVNESVANYLKDQKDLLKGIIDGTVSASKAAEAFLSSVRATHAEFEAINQISKVVGKIASPKISISNLSAVGASGGAIPNLSSEVDGAKRGGYIAGRVVGTMVNDGFGQTPVIANTAESKSTIFDSQNRPYDFINPPEGSPAGQRHRMNALAKLGIDPYTLPQMPVVAGGRVPNLALSSSIIERISAMGIDVDRDIVARSYQKRSDFESLPETAVSAMIQRYGNRPRDLIPLLISATRKAGAGGGFPQTADKMLKWLRPLISNQEAVQTKRFQDLRTGGLEEFITSLTGGEVLPSKGTLASRVASLNPDDIQKVLDLYGPTFPFLAAYESAGNPVAPVDRPQFKSAVEVGGRKFSVSTPIYGHKTFASKHYERMRKEWQNASGSPELPASGDFGRVFGDFFDYAMRGEGMKVGLRSSAGASIDIPGSVPSILSETNIRGPVSGIELKASVQEAIASGNMAEKIFRVLAGEPVGRTLKGGGTSAHLGGPVDNVPPLAGIKIFNPNAGKIGILDADAFGQVDKRTSAFESLVYGAIATGKAMKVHYGPMGSGKTHVARQIAGENNFVLSPDDLARFDQFILNKTDLANVKEGRGIFGLALSASSNIEGFYHANQQAMKEKILSRGRGHEGREEVASAIANKYMSEANWNKYGENMEFLSKKYGSRFSLHNYSTGKVPNLVSDSVKNRIFNQASALPNGAFIIEKLQEATNLSSDDAFIKVAEKLGVRVGPSPEVSAAPNLDSWWRKVDASMKRRETIQNIPMSDNEVQNINFLQGLYKRPFTEVLGDTKTRRAGKGLAEIRETAYSEGVTSPNTLNLPHDQFIQHLSNQYIEKSRLAMLSRKSPRFKAGLMAIEFGLDDNVFQSDISDRRQDMAERFLYKRFKKYQQRGRFASGKIPNLATQLGYGAYGSFWDLEKTVAGIPLGEKIFKKRNYDPSGMAHIRERQKEQRIGIALHGFNDRLSQVGVKFPKVFSDEEAAKYKLPVVSDRVYKEVVKDKVFKSFLTQDLKTHPLYDSEKIERNFEMYVDSLMQDLTPNIATITGIEPGDVHWANYSVNRQGRKSLFNSFMTKTEHSKALNDFLKQQGLFTIFDVGMFDDSSFDTRIETPSDSWRRPSTPYQKASRSDALGSIPNLTNPIKEALDAENRATGGHAKLSRSRALVSPMNPMGLVAIDSRNQKNGDDAVSQHMMLGQALSKIKVMRSSGGKVPNLAVDAGSGLFGNTSVASSIILGLASYGQQLVSTSALLDKFKSGMGGLISVQEHQAISLRKMDKEYEKARDTLLETGKVEYGGKTYSTKNSGLTNLEKAFTDNTRSLRESVAPYLKKQEEDRRTLAGKGLSFSLKAGMIGGIATQAAERFSPNAGAVISELTSGATTAGQVLNAFPTRAGKGIAAGIAGGTVVSAIDTFSKGLASQARAYEIAQGKFQKLVAQIDGMTVALSNFDTFVGDSTVSLETLVREQRKYSELLGSLGSTPEGQKVVARLAGAGDTRTKIARLSEVKAEQTRDLELQASVLALKQYASNRTLNVFGKVIGGGRALGYANELEKQAVTDITRNASSAGIATIPTDLKTSLMAVADSPEKFETVLNASANTSGAKLQTFFKEIEEAVGKKGLGKIKNQIRESLATEQLYTSPQGQAQLSGLQTRNAERQLAMDAAIRREASMRRQFVNQGSMLAGNALDIRAMENRNAYNNTLASYAQNQAVGGLYQLKFGERSNREFQTNVELEKIEGERSNRTKTVQGQATRTIVDQLTQNFDDYIRNTEFTNTLAPAGQSAIGNIAEFKTTLIESLNKGISTTVGQGNLDRFKNSAGVFDQNMMVEAIAANSGGDKKTQQGVLDYLRNNSSVDILKTIQSANTELVSINQEAYAEAQRQTIALEGFRAEMNFKELASFMGGIRNLLDRNSRRSTERELIRSVALLEKGSTKEIRGMGGAGVLNFFKNNNVPIDLSGKTPMSQLMVKAWDAAGSGLVDSQQKSLSRIMRSTGILTGGDSVESKGIKGFASAAAAQARAQAALQSEFKPENKELFQQVANQIDFSPIAIGVKGFKTALDDSAINVTNFAKALAVSKADFLKAVADRAKTQKEKEKERNDDEEKTRKRIQETSTFTGGNEDEGKSFAWASLAKEGAGFGVGLGATVLSYMLGRRRGGAKPEGAEIPPNFLQRTGDFLKKPRHIFGPPSTLRGSYMNEKGEFAEYLVDHMAQQNRAKQVAIARQRDADILADARNKDETFTYRNKQRANRQAERSVFTGPIPQIPVDTGFSGGVYPQDAEKRRQRGLKSVQVLPTFPAPAPTGIPNVIVPPSGPVPIISRSSLDLIRGGISPQSRNALNRPPIIPPSASGFAASGFGGGFGGLALSQAAYLGGASFGGDMGTALMMGSSFAPQLLAGTKAVFGGSSLMGGLAAGGAMGTFGAGALAAGVGYGGYKLGGAIYNSATGTGAIQDDVIKRNSQEGKNAFQTVLKRFEKGKSEAEVRKEIEALIATNEGSIKSIGGGLKAVGSGKVKESLKSANEDLKNLVSNLGAIKDTVDQQKATQEMAKAQQEMVKKQAALMDAMTAFFTKNGGASGSSQVNSNIKVEISLKDGAQIPEMITAKLINPLTQQLNELTTRVNGIVNKTNPQPAKV
jgi:TP901 family phage tail tape measure protein